MKKLLKDKKSFEVFLDLTCLHILDTVRYLENENTLFTNYYDIEYYMYVPFINLFNAYKIDSIFKINFTHYRNVEIKEKFIAKLLTKHLKNRRKLYKLYKSIVLNYNNYANNDDIETQQNNFEAYLRMYYICKNLCAFNHKLSGQTNNR